MSKDIRFDAKWRRRRIRVLDGRLGPGPSLWGWKMLVWSYQKAVRRLKMAKDSSYGLQLA